MGSLLAVPARPDHGGEDTTRDDENSQEIVTSVEPASSSSSSSSSSEAASDHTAVQISDETEILQDRLSNIQIGEKSRDSCGGDIATENEYPQDSVTASELDTAITASDSERVTNEVDSSPVQPSEIPSEAVVESTGRSDGSATNDVENPKSNASSEESANALTDCSSARRTTEIENPSVSETPTEYVTPSDSTTDTMYTFISTDDSDGEFSENGCSWKLVDAITAYNQANSLLSVEHSEKHELRASVNYVLAGIYLKLAERDPYEDVCVPLLREVVDLLGEAFRPAPYLLRDNVNVEVDDANRRFCQRFWPINVTCPTSAAEEVLRHCAEALGCLQLTSDENAPCVFFDHGSDDKIAKSFVEEDDHAEMRRVFRHAIMIRIANACTIYVQHSIKKGFYERGYKFSVLAIKTCARILSNFPVIRQHIAASLLLKRYFCIFSIIVAGIATGAGNRNLDYEDSVEDFIDDFTRSGDESVSEEFNFEDLWITRDALEDRKVAIDYCKHVLERDHPNETDEFWDQTPPERTKVNVGDFCSSATAAAKIADIYKDRADPIVREHRRGLVHLQALDEMEIARILYVRALSMLSPINSRLATRLVIRVLPTLVYTSAVIFRSMINDLDPDSHAHSVLLAMTMQYLNLLKRFETTDPHPYFADGSYGGCLLIVASGYTMFSQALLKHSDESVKAKGIDCLEMALDAHNVILRNNATSTQKSHSFDELATVYEKLIRAKIEHFASLVNKETTTAEELRTLSKNCAYLVLNFHDHMIQVLLNREAPVEEENVNFEVCGLQQWLIRAEHVSDNAKLFGCRQLLIWLRMMVGNTVLTVSDPDKAVDRLRALRFEIEKLMLGMTLRFPQHAYLRTGFELMHKIRADEVSTLSHEISTSILEILESIPPIEVIDEIPDYVPVNIVEE